jgi:putative ABC transport system ATP-binding protein
VPDYNYNLRESIMHHVIETKNLSKTFYLGDIEVHALRGVNISVASGEMVAIMGSSGSGKSTLMNLLGCLDQPTSGEYYLDGINMKTLKKDEYAEIRNHKIGFVFQGFNLLSRTTALENVEMPLLYDRERRIKNPGKAAKEALDRVGLADRMDHVPSQLSGGQQQRVAIARALVNQPALILADEPTGNLDSRTSVDVLSVFQELNQQGITIVMVTHEQELTYYAKRVLEMRDGRIRRDYPVENRRQAVKDLEQMDVLEDELA